jgi:hypothetical protein
MADQNSPKGLLTRCLPYSILVGDSVGHHVYRVDLVLTNRLE